MIRVFAQGATADEVLVSPEKFHHLKRVLRIKTGDSIEAIFEGKLFQCIYESDKLKIQNFKEISVKKNKLIIVCGLSSQGAIETILEKCTELGVAHFIFFKAENSTSQNFDKFFDEKKIQRSQRVILSAAEQSNQDFLPKIQLFNSLNEALAQNPKSKGFYGKPRSQQFTPDRKKILQITCDYAEHILVIGPEGGLTKTEETFCDSFGYEPISIGEGILRVETACISLVAVLTYLQES